MLNSSNKIFYLKNNMNRNDIIIIEHNNIMKTIINYCTKKLTVKASSTTVGCQVK